MSTKNKTTALPKGNRSTAAATPASSSRPTQGARETKALTPAQQKAKDLGHDHRLVSDLADRYVQLKPVKYDGTNYIIEGFTENAQGRKIEYHKVLRDIEISPSKIVYNAKTKEPIGYIPIPKKSWTERVREIIRR